MKKINIFFQAIIFLSLQPLVLTAQAQSPMVNMLLPDQTEDGATETDQPKNVAVEKNNTEINYQYINQIFNKGDIIQAKKLAEEYLKKNPKDGDVKLILAKIYTKEKNSVLAKQQLEEILVNYPSYMDARLMLTNLHIQEGNYSLGLKIINEGLVLQPNNKDLLEKKSQLEELEHAKEMEIYKNSVSTVLLTNEKKPSIQIIPYTKMNDQFERGNIEVAKNMALTYLKSNPNDGDVRFLLARIYIKEGNNFLAEKELVTVLQRSPHYNEVRIALINIKISEKSYNEALQLINIGLIKDANNRDLLLKKAQVYYLTKDYTASLTLLKKLLLINPNDLDAKKMLNSIKDISPKLGIGLNQLGVMQGLYNVSGLPQLWDYTTLFYTRDTDYGPVTASVNYASRLGFKAAQGQIEAYPRLSKYVYLDLLAAYANNPNLFPNYTLGGEGFISIPNFIDPSFGATYKKITDLQKLTTYTGSLARNIGSYWISFRPYYFTPNSGDDSILYALTLRRNFNDTGDFYLGLTFSAGDSPDLYDLTSVDFIVTHNTMVGLNFEFPLDHHRFVIDLGASYQHQVFPNDLIRDISGGTIGVRYRF